MTHDPTSPDVAATLAATLADVRSRIARAAGGRRVELIAVSKTKPAAMVEAMIAAGQLVFGENRVQEAALKFTPLRIAHPAIDLHLIGPLQTNKVRDAVLLFDQIETLDRPKLADALAAAAEREGDLPHLLVQVNIGDEPQKAGIARAEADGFIRAMRARFGAALQGLMAIPPLGADPAPYFRDLVAMADHHGLPIRSIGMSDDFETAIACGATQVRVGSALFGNRPDSATPLGS
ncbi:YggS family pyridoxal phosphate-dependent enzyme [Acidiphilium sp.]|uniref:YggS family pyridoxal phosphate-dependent enzyme n=1 Tax=Acidiphilium sp. TaxID=527 RepID=UPI003CFF95DC